MFSPLAKGHGSWDGHFDDESTLDSLFPSIYETSIHNEAKLLKEETIGVTKTNDHALQLPKTFVTRKGAMMLFAQNGPHTVLGLEKQHRNDEKIKVDTSLMVEEQMPQLEKRKMLLEFLDMFLKDETGNQHPHSKPIQLKENNWTSEQNEEAENAFKVLSRPKSINSLYDNESLIKRQKQRPNTAIPANVIPKEPEQPKAHPRITSGKPRLPTRALGKLPKSARSEFDKEKTSCEFLHAPSSENHQTYATRQLTTPNYSTTKEMVQEDQASTPKPNSECHFERPVSRAASSISRYSTWWAMDNVSLSCYDNEHQDDDDECQECVECLSEQRSEIGRITGSDYGSDIDTETGSRKRAISNGSIPKSKESDSLAQFSVNDKDVGEENKDEFFSQNCPSSRDSQQAFYREMKEPAPSCEADFINTTARTFEDVWFKEIALQEQPSKNRVKSAPCRTERNQLMFRRKARSAGLKRSHTPTTVSNEHETASENVSIRIPSAASCYDDDNDHDILLVSKDDSEKAPIKSGTLEESSDAESTSNRRPSGVVFSSKDVEDSGHEVKTTNAIDDDMFKNSTQLAEHHSSKTSRNPSSPIPTSALRKPPKQDTAKLAKQNSSTKFGESNIKDSTQDILIAEQDRKPVKQGTKLTRQDRKPAKQDIKPVKQDIKPVKQVTEPAKQNTKVAEKDMKPTKKGTKPAEQYVKPVEQGICPGSDVIEPQLKETSATSNSQAYLTEDNEVNQTQYSSQNVSATSDLSESHNTELDNAEQMQINETIPSVVLPSEGDLTRISSKDEKENQEINPTKEENVEERLGFYDKDDDGVANCAREDEANYQEDMPREIDELEEDGGVESDEETAPDGNMLELAATVTKALDFQKLPEKTVNKNHLDIGEHTIQLSSEMNFRPDEPSEKAETLDSSKVREFPMKEADPSAEISGEQQSSSGKDTAIRDTHSLALGSRDSFKPTKEQESGGNSSTDTQKLKRQGYIREDLVSNARTFESKITANNELQKSKLDANSTTKSPKVKTEKTNREKLDIHGVGKADNQANQEKEKVEIKMENKVDLSGLLAKKSNNKTVKKPTALGKKAKSAKTVRKRTTVPDQTPEPAPSLDVIPAVDENLLKMIENSDGALELSEETLNQFAPAEDFQEPDATSVTEEKPIKTSDAFSPSKVKKGGKKGGRSSRKKGKIDDPNATGTRRDGVAERKRKMAEEKAKQEEEMKLLKEREDEQRRLLEEAKEKQRTIEEEREKRLVQENEARREEEEAEKALKEAKRKAKEEREKRREEEAERRRMEVQKKREEKRKRELEIQKQEQELEKQRVDREKKMAELRAQKEKELELERLAEEQRQEEERRRLLELEAEKREEEKRIREAEEAVQRMAREREYREQMRKIAEAQQVKLEKQELERRAQEEAERAAIEEERKRLEHEAQMREHEEQERVRELRQKEAIARIRAAHEASKRRAWALRRRAQNTERMANLKFTRQAQKLTEAFTFSYHVRVPREVWELPYDWNSKKKRASFRPKKKQNGGKKT